MTEQSLSYEERLQKNFLDAWTHYLEFNINRYRRVGFLAGSPIKALIAQVIYWHELLILSEKGTAEQFISVREDINKVISSLVSMGMPVDRVSVSTMSVANVENTEIRLYAY